MDKIKIKQQQQLFIIMAIIAIIPTLILGGISLLTATQGVEQEIKQANQQVLEQVEYQVENILENIKASYIKLASDYQILDCLNMPLDYSQYTSWKYLVEALGISKMDEYVRGAQLINWQQGWVASNFGIAENSDMPKPDKLVKLEKDVQWVNRKDSERIFSTLIIRLPLYSEQTDQILFVDVDQKEISTMIGKIVGANHYLIENGKGDIVFSNITPEIFEGLERGKYKFSYIIGGYNNWNYIIPYEKTKVLVGVAPIAYAILGVCLIIIVIASIISKLSAQKAYKPIEKLFYSLKRVDEDKDINGEYIEYVYRGIEQLIDSNESMSVELKEKLRRAEELFLLKLIKGDITEHTLNEYKNMLHINQVENKNMVLLVCEIQNGYNCLQQHIDELGFIQNIKEKFTFCESVYTLTIGNQIVVLLCITDHQEEWIDIIIAAGKELVRQVDQEYNYKLRISISKKVSEFLKVESLYKECIEMLRRKDIELEEQEEAVIQYNQFIESIQEFEVRYPKHIEDEILGAILTHNRKDIEEKVNRFIETIDNQSIRGTERYYFYMKLSIALVEFAMNQGIMILENEQIEIDKPYHMLSRDVLIREFMQNLIDPIVDRLEEGLESNRKRIVLEINKLLLEECDNDITLKECAYKLNYHPTYIWRILKEEMNTTFSDYLLELRLTKAKKLLTDTDLSIKEIAAELRYNNSQNFIRYFKKLEGVTPGEFRKTYKQV